MSKTAILKRVGRWAAAGLAMVVGATGLYAPEASAHGEKSQQAFLRMRTIHWYDLRWSTDKLKVNDKMTVSGKFHVFKGWPETAANPQYSPAFLNIGIPGPVFTRVESYIGGQFVPRSVNLTLGENYTFKVVLQARRPGRWHVHTMLNVEAAGPIIGPGKWVQIEGTMADYKHEVRTLTGSTEDIERVGTSGILAWSWFWYLFGCAWIAYWACKPLFIPRYIAVKQGVPEEELVSPTDEKVGLCFGVAAIAIVALSYWSANATYPVTIPLQAGVIGLMDPIPAGAPAVEVGLERATYRVPGRSVNIKIRVANRGVNPVQVAEFETAGIRFLNPTVYKDDTNYPPQLLAPEGLTVDDNSPILPGHSRVITVTCTDAAWENERLGDAIYDPDARFGGLFFFADTSGFRHLVPVGGPLIPDFGYPAQQPDALHLCTKLPCEVRTWYATDRKPADDPTSDPSFGNELGSLRFGFADVNIPEGHIPGRVERPLTVLTFTMGTEDRKKHVVVLDIKELTRDEFIMYLKGSVLALRGKTGKGEVLVFIHGYNVTVEEALHRTAQLAFDLHFEGAPILYSWPAAGNKRDYGRDKELSEYTTPSFLDFLKLVRTELGADTVHVIAHSMGSKVLASAFRHLKKIDNVHEAPMRQIVFAAPDIDDKTFPTLAEAFKENAERVTVYYSTRDFALSWLSWLVHGGHERVGASGELYTSIDTIDASAACPDIFCHALLESPLVINDLNLLIRHDDPPERRSLAWRRSDNDLPYWELRRE